MASLRDSNPLRIFFFTRRNQEFGFIYQECEFTCYDFLDEFMEDEQNETEVLETEGELSEFFQKTEIGFEC